MGVVIDNKEVVLDASEVISQAIPSTAVLMGAEDSGGLLRALQCLADGTLLQSANPKAFSETGITTNKNGASQDVSSHPKQDFTVQIVRTSGADNASIRLEGSLDGSNWEDLSGDQAMSASSLMFHVAGKLVQYFRYVTTSVGTSTFSVFIVGV